MTLLTLTRGAAQQVATAFSVVDRRPRLATYKPTIVWSTGTANDTAEYDDVSQWYLNQPGLVVDGIGRDQARAYAPPAAPAFDLTLTNWTGRFSPGGPIGSMVGRGPKTYLDMLWGNDELCNSAEVMANDSYVNTNGIEAKRLFDGEVNTAQHTLTRPQRSVAVRALGRFSILLDKRPQTTQLYEHIRTDQAISVLLNLVGWDPAKRVLDTGDTELLYWWLDGSQDGLAVLNQLLEAEGAGGCAYEQAGVFHFEGRQYRQNATRSTNDQWIFVDGPLPNPAPNDPFVGANDAAVLANGRSEAVVLFDINPSAYSSNPDEVISSATMTVNQRSPTAVMKVWELGAALTLSPGQVFVTEGTTRDPYRSAVTPVAGTDYTVTAGAVTPVLLASSGTLIRIQWTAGAGGATVFGTTSNGPQLRAVSLPVISEVVVRSIVDTSSQAARYQPREHQMDSWPEIERTQALDIVNSMALRYMTERRQATLRIANLDGAHMDAIMHVRVSDKLRWYQQHGNIYDPYWVEQISHEIAPGGGLHIMTLGVERVFDAVGGKFDQSVWGVFPNNALFGE